MAIHEKTTKKGYGRAIISDKVRSHATDPFFVKKNEEAKEALNKTDWSALKKK